MVGGLLVGALMVSLDPGIGAGAAPPQAPQAQDPSPGWSIDGRATGDRRITWRSRSPLPMGSARFEFFAGGRPLGVPEVSADRRALTLTRPPGTTVDVGSLEVRAAGRRWDGPSGVPRQESVPRASRRPMTTAPGQYDPGVPGPFTTVSGEYSLPAVDFPGFDAPLEMQAVVVAPAAAPGPRPVVLLLHGRHPACSGTAEAAWWQWPCPAGTSPIPSYRGHLDEQRLLASQGFLTISISGNSINAQDDRNSADGGIQARSSLIRHHLAAWSGWADRSRGDVPDVVRLAPAADLSRVVLMGHSRGGEGANRAALDSRTPPGAADGFDAAVTWQIRGTFLITPTLLGHNPVPNVPSVVLLAGCDGDVYDQQGQLYADGTRTVSRQNALHSTVFVVGANHNYFNSEWVPGTGVAPAWDDWSLASDPVCGTGSSSRRLSAAAQKTVGATYLAAAAQLFALGEHRVRPLLDGAGERVGSTGAAEIFTNAVGGARGPLVVLPRLSAADPSVDATMRVCAAVDVNPLFSCLGGTSGDAGRSPHFAKFLGLPQDTGRTAVALRWSSAGQPIGLPLVSHASARAADAVALRVIVPPNSQDTSFDVALRDTRGRSATIGTVTLDGLPGTTHTVAYQGQEVRVPLSRARSAGLDLDHVAGLEIVPRTDSGRAWLLDAWTWQPTAAEFRSPAPARADLSSVRSFEGDSGTRTHLVPVAVSGGPGWPRRAEPRQLRVYLVERATGQMSERLVTVPRGARRVEIPVEVPADTVHGPDVRIAVLAKGVKGLVVGNFLAELVVQNDDPPPSGPATH